MKHWHVYTIDERGNARHWSTSWTRWGAKRSADQFTLIPAFMIMSPMVVHDDEMDDFREAYDVAVL